MADRLRYPQYDLKSSIDVARTLHSKGGTGSAAELAEYLGYSSVNNGAFLTRVASAKLFELLDGQAKAYQVSERALRILAPESDAAAEQDKVEAFLSVPLFKAVFDRFHDQPLPDAEGLANSLRVNFSIPETQAKAAVARLLDSADEAGLFRVAGNRSKMIRPSRGNGAGDGRPLGAPAGDKGSPGGSAGSGSGTRARDHKIVDGVLDLLPPVKPDGGWDEQGLAQWLAFFEGAVRMLYKLPEPTKGTGTSTAGSGAS